MHTFRFLLGFLAILVVTGCKPVHAGPYTPYKEPVEVHPANLTPEEWEEKWWEAEKRAHQLWEQTEKGWHYFLENERLKEQLAAQATTAENDRIAGEKIKWLIFALAVCGGLMFVYHLWPRKPG